MLGQTKELSAPKPDCQIESADDNAAMKKLTSTPAAIAQLVKEYPTKNPSEIAKIAKGLGYTAVSTSIVKTIMAKLPQGK